MDVIDKRDRPNLVPDIVASLRAKMERLLEHPLIACVRDADGGDDRTGLPDIFLALRDAARASSSPARSPWREDPEDGTCTVEIVVDYDGAWRGRESEVRELVQNTIDTSITFLTDAQRKLLEERPREFLALLSPPEVADLVSYRVDRTSGCERVVELTLAAAPKSREGVRHVAIVPNLVQLARQLAGARCVEQATDDGPLAPLRALVGLADPALLAGAPAERTPASISLGADVDEHQADCVSKAIETPHFAVIHGPPGSGKTTVIADVIRNALARGDRVLVVSPTHSAIDNVVEWLVRRRSGEVNRLDATSLPVRFAARPAKLSERARDYWVGARGQLRGATIARLVADRLAETVPIASKLLELVDASAPGHAPISSAVASLATIICGTPIGILSHPGVRDAAPGSFGVLIVDEVSRMTLPEFLAVAVKARRWVLVGDPAQLPPYSDAAENGATLVDVLPPILELACSVGAAFERRDVETPVIVVSSNPSRAIAVVRAHLDEVIGRSSVAVGGVDAATIPDVVVCSVAELDRARDVVARLRNASSAGAGVLDAPMLVERGVALPPTALVWARLVKDDRRAAARIFEIASNTLHIGRWADRAQQLLGVLGDRRGLVKLLPSRAAIDAAEECAGAGAAIDRPTLVRSIATRFAINTFSLFEWLTDPPAPTTAGVSPLMEALEVRDAKIVNAARPFVGVLRRQYRMHESLSRVPRELFYFGDALHDSPSMLGPGCCVELVQVRSTNAVREANLAEVAKVVELLASLDGMATRGSGRANVMVITPYRVQETELRNAVDRERNAGRLRAAEIQTCTLDRCQGREADFVLVSLVRDRATNFYEMPTRWNVALTRARHGLFLIGDIDAFLNEARSARAQLRPPGARYVTRSPAGEHRPQMSVLARIVEAYRRQLDERPLRLAVGAL
ncbi:MAG: AAA domain-containing protein [Polyangiales bacterium]